MYKTLCALALTLCCGCGNRANSNTTTAVAPTDAPTQYTYKIKAVYPHSTTAYTQGLIWQDGTLIEGTGGYGDSRLRRVELTTGKELKAVRLDPKLFGEGIAQLGDKIYQLTWMEGKALVYSASNFEKVGEFTISGEGWGLTTDGRVLYMSDGTDKIYVVDPQTFAIQSTISVTTGTNSVGLLNELEWVNGEIWANVYMSDFIVRINPQSGKVTGIIDLDGLLSEADRTSQTDVLNGIAYDSTTNKLVVTGKNWNKIFEIELQQRP